MKYYSCVFNFSKICCVKNVVCLNVVSYKIRHDIYDFQQNNIIVHFKGLYSIEVF